MADLGDLTDFLKEASVADHDWLDVDEADYRALDTLPKQNLDIAPDLEAAWSHEDKPASSYVPNMGDAPRTMGDLSKEHGKLASDTRSLVRKVARCALMVSTDLNHFKSSLTSRFDRDVLKLASEDLRSVLSERGLIGKLYVNAGDFPDADNPKSASASFLKKYASGAKYVVVNPAEKNCVRAFTAPNGSEVCSVFHKEVVLEVPYTEALATAIEKRQASQGKVVQASNEDPKERIRKAFLASNFEFKATETPKPVVDPKQFMKATVAAPKIHLRVLSSEAEVMETSSLEQMGGIITASEAQEKVKTAAMQKKAADVTALLRREMLRGRSERELIQSLKIAFSVADLQETRPVWEPLFQEAGLYGTVYSTQNSFDDCRDGADFLAKFNPTVKAIVAGSKCDGCIYNKAARCLMYGKPIVKDASELMTDETVKSAIQSYRSAGRLETGAERVAWGEDPKSSLKALYRNASSANPMVPTRIDVFRAFRGTESIHKTSSLVKRNIVKTASKYMNEGLYGDQLLEALKRQFEARDLVAAKEDLKPVLAEQGLQGIYYVDASVYDDYGKGCNEAERLHRSRLVSYVKASSACGSCVHQRQGGWCSKINKPLVDEVPYIDKQAQQREILASGNSTEVSYNSLINNGLTMMQEFQLHNAGMEIELNPMGDISLDYELGGQKVKV